MCDFCEKELLRYDKKPSGVELPIFQTEEQNDWGGTFLVYSPYRNSYDIWSEVDDSWFSGVAIHYVRFCPLCGRELKGEEN